VTAGFAQEEISYEQMGKYYDLMEQFYGQKSYSLDVKYSSYKGHDSQVPEDVMNGYVVKENELQESYQLGIFSIQNEEIKVFLDSTEKYVGITFPDKGVAQGGFDEKTFEESKSRMDKVLLTYEGRDAIIQFQFKPGYEYSSIEMRIAPDGLIKETILYFSADVEYEKASGEKSKEKVKVVIKSSPSKRKIKNKVETVLKQDGGSYQLTAPYSTYELMDFRYQTN
jgi:hypothetical protein